MTDIDVELDDVASRALAAIILERTADAMRDGGAEAGAALTGLVDDTGLVIDVCAAILQATTWVAGAGGVTDEALFAASLALTPDDPGEGVATPDNPEWATMTGAEIVEHEFGDIGADEDHVGTIAGMQCPQCSAIRPDEMHREWCTYDGYEPGE